MHSRLMGMRCYMAGSMDAASDNGVGWRKWLTPILQERFGITIIDPSNKPIDAGTEHIEDRKRRQKLLENEDYDTLQKEIRLLRCVDLRMVDLADFLIVYIDKEIPMFGTIEEIALANRSKKPILVYVRQFKKNSPGWLFGMIPHQHIFSSWEDLLEYLRHVHEDEKVEHFKRWWFFDYSKLGAC